MDVFKLRDTLIKDYADYIRSFITIRERKIDGYVRQALAAGLLWPDPLLQLNPSFEPGQWIDTLVDQQVLHPLCRQIFRKKEEHQVGGQPLRLHKHQTDALIAAQSGDNYVLTTGTGSGKSLAYLIPIVDHVLRQGSGKGIQAIIIYPMNALANSQFNELEKFLTRGFSTTPVTFRRYTGQESEQDKEAIIHNPPDILLTNYVMMELLLTRPYEKPIIEAAQGLQFLVLDELHTYRGRQGADVAMLVRRVREACASPSMQCVGTSATLAEGGTLTEQQQVIAKVAGNIFGSRVEPERVMGETLQRFTPAQDISDPDFVARLTRRLTDNAQAPPPEAEAFQQDPLCIWIESIFGLDTEPETGRLKRATPTSIAGESGAAAQLADLTGLPQTTCETAIKATLLAGYRVLHPETGFPVFAFRLHQFLSRGDTIYASLEAPADRYLTTQRQMFVPGDRNRVLLPLAFCRACGQEYYTVEKVIDPQTNTTRFLPRAVTDYLLEDGEGGFLYHAPDNPWPDDPAAIIERLPDDWLDLKGTTLVVKKHQQKNLPQPVWLNTRGAEDEDGTRYHYLRSPFRFCLNCGIAYGGRERSDFGKLATLSSEGRSTATTVLSLAAIRALRGDETLERTAQKLLSFTDNRQDASLQAGHFNDFVEVGLLRAALYKAVSEAGPAGLTHDTLPLRVFEALNLPLDLYAVNPDVKFQARHDTERALREVLAYRLYQDQRRGWRITSPNLEQCGLLVINYASLDDLAAAEDEWVDCHPVLATASPTTRQHVAKTLLDYLRREKAIKVSYLERPYQERIQQMSSQRLVEPWAIDENERLDEATIALPRSERKQPRDYGGHLYVSAQGGFGMFLRQHNTFENYPDKMTLDDARQIIGELLAVLSVAGLVEAVLEETLPDGSAGYGYQIPASALHWTAGDGSLPPPDPIRVRRASTHQPDQQANEFFVTFYREAAAGLQGIAAHEHTAQVPYDEREQREARFRTGELPVLYCSPTMELGVDISQLNAVNMRNVPPTPANYAQRSGRAGRSGQPALVFTYCTTGSPHDQYFFRRPAQMVAGAVTPPRMDLANEDLIKAHVHAVWLAETGLSLGTSLKALLDLSGDTPSLALQPSVLDAIRNITARDRAMTRLNAIFATLDKEQLVRADWFTPEWLAQTINQVEQRFDAACDRWRSLYQAARAQRILQNQVIGDASRNSGDKDQARRLRAEAEAQLDLLTESKNVAQSDFYSYRYFASEGFLPGYNFPRLPLSAYIPGRRGRRTSRDDQQEFLSRPRFLAIAEFGPRSIIYHEGSRYLINKVILPVTDDVLTAQAKLCSQCSYVYRLDGTDPGPDLCERCGTAIGAVDTLAGMFRMQNVATRRRDRINSDEEERTRMGYDIKTGLRFNPRGDSPGYHTAMVHDSNSQPLFQLTYGNAATLWRINQGWRRRKDKSSYGFVLDTERGFWARNEAVAPDDPDDPMSASNERVIPYVEDWRNCLLVEPVQPLDLDVMASLQPALKNAIQVCYQLEDNELAAEPLPTADNRRLILLYEAAEGGAGVLRQLLDDPRAVREVGREALTLCHFDPDDGTDVGYAPGESERCEAACYSCLMSYANQLDHPRLDRLLIRDLLLALSQSTLSRSSGPTDRAHHLDVLKQQCDSDLERDWLDMLEAHKLHLPDQAQPFLALCNTKPDFLYKQAGVAIYIDGPVHDAPDKVAEDTRLTDCLINHGYEVIRFGYRDKATWADLCAGYPYIFGPGPI